MKIKKEFLLIVMIAVLSNLVFSEYVKVKSPNGGEQWELGTEKTITWEKSGSYTKFRIVLQKNNVRVGDIAWVNNPDKTSYKWEKVGEYINGSAAAGNDYKIRIRGYLSNGGSKIDDSDSNFKITEKNTPKFQVSNIKKKKRVTDINITPSGGKYKTGQKLQINWKTNWKTHKVFLLELFNDNGMIFKRGLGKSKPGYMNFVWTIPGNILEGFYTIRITTRESTQLVRGLSGKFQISWAYKDKASFFLIIPKIDNRMGIRKKGDVTYNICKLLSRQNERAPDPGEIRVGYSSYIWGKGANQCFCYYRSHVLFDLTNIPKDGIIKEAKLKFDKNFGPCKATPIIFVLNQKWNKSGNPEGLKGHHANPEDFRKIVKKWLLFPKANYGLRFTGRGGGKVDDVCLLYLSNVRLILRIRERIK